jgi:hemoglobin
MIIDAPPRTPFELIGGRPAVRRLVDAFYDRMQASPAYARLRAMHAADLSPMRERLADWLDMWMGGPTDYAARHPGRGCIASAHRPFRIDAEAAGQWLSCMREALQEAGVGGAGREFLDEAFARMCEALANR